MAVEIFADRDGKGEVFVCNTTDLAFGPIMEDGTAELFMEWLDIDPREVEEILPKLYDKWYRIVYMEGQSQYEPNELLARDD